MNFAHAPGGRSIRRFHRVLGNRQSHAVGSPHVPQNSVSRGDSVLATEVAFEVQVQRIVASRALHRDGHVEEVGPVHARVHLHAHREQRLLSRSN